MSRILILQATGRAGGTVAAAAKLFAENLKKSSENEIETVDVLKLHFHPCTGCMKCRASHTCVFAGDDAEIAGKKMEEADVIVVAAPVYWGNMPGVLKSFFDRNVYKMMDEGFSAIPKPLMKGKKGIIITACSTPFPFNIVCRQTSGLIRAVKEIFKYSGIKITKVIAIPGTKAKQGVPEPVKKHICKSAALIAKSLLITAGLSISMPGVFAGQKTTATETAETSAVSTEKIQPAHWDFSAVTDLAFYPKSDYVTGATHYAPVTGIYDGFECRTTLHARYTIPVPFNDTMLFSGNTLSFDAGLAISPISIMPKLMVSFTPVAFFNFFAGANLGTAWEFLGIKSLSRYDSAKGGYEQMVTFKTWFYQFWICSTFMFDTAALFPGDWNHIIMAASYELNYSGLLNADNNSGLFQWQTTRGMTEGLQYVSTFTAGYQMPLKLSLVGAQLELSGYMNGSDFEDTYKKYDGAFMTISMSPLAQITLNKKDSIFLLAVFSSRRSFEQEHDKADDEPLLTQSGREWYFRRLSCSWTHMF